MWDVAYAVPLMTRDLLGGRSGVISGRLTPRPTPPFIDRGGYFDDGSDETREDTSISKQFVVQVTPFEVHAKLGHYNTLVWVTKLSTGLPVARAKVRIFADASNAASVDDPAILGEATTDAAGIAMLPGRDKLDPRRHADGLRQPGRETPHGARRRR